LWWKQRGRFGASLDEVGSQRHFGFFVFYPRLVGNPVHFPGLASIIGEGLFKVRRAGVRVAPNISNQDAFSIERVLGVKLTTSVLKLTDLRRLHLASLAVGPEQAPLVGLGII
jgi:hypothetical protein